ncbi:helix-turn-helix transcriptional regulator [Chitinophaga arvensicola]|uniref:HTH araC/xylS-type domain-containing protein n=1 Tax=Chitinophaga arvensicola TaxID=29529 RepID=A0A1I0SB38_9BACT|nr:helix-turn-helix transcriptional regulator [Chitinophaga arvensicola]SEW53936.1 hypothetical protein SAMN04488122_5776 [Chitinophaga arvensicola]
MESPEYKGFLPRIPLRIETDDMEFIPAENLPEEYSHLPILAAKISFLRNENADVICQTVELDDFTIRTHEVYAMENILLIPHTKKEIFALHFMAGGEIAAELSDSGPYMMCKREMALFRLLPSKHKAIMKQWEVMFSFHIDILPETLGRLAAKYPELQQLASKTLREVSAPVNQDPYEINQVCMNLIDEICNCKLVGHQAKVFMHRCCLELYFNFAAQDKLSSQPMRIFPLYITQKLPDALIFLKQHTGEAFSMAKMAVTLDLTMQELREAFIDSYFMTPEAYHLQQQMLHAYKMAMNATCTLEEIGRSIAMNNVEEFIVLFESYFNCSIVTIRNAQ